MVRYFRWVPMAGFALVVGREGGCGGGQAAQQGCHGRDGDTSVHGPSFGSGVLTS